VIQGTPKFTGLAIGSFSVDKMSSPTIQIKAKAAFIDPATGVTYGWTVAEGGLWSKETLEKLNDLMLSMENDIANVHFEGGGSAPVTSTGAAPAAGGGLNEHLGGDAPSV
jgi:hypothetical protein